MNKNIFGLNFTEHQKKIFLLLVLSGICDGISEGILILQETIALKALSASKFEISLISIIMFATLIFSLFFTSYLKGKPKTNLLVFSMVAGRTIFFFSFLINSTRIYLFFLFLFYSTYSISFPVINMFYQRHFPRKRGFVFGIYRMLLMVLTMVASVVAGKILDITPSNYKIILSFVGLFSSVSFISLIIIDKNTDYSISLTDKIINSINTNRNIYIKTKTSDNIYTNLNKKITGKKIEKINKTSFKNNFVENFKEIIKEKDFIVFEMLFMTYGFGFMIIQPAIPVYLINILGFTYSQMAYAKGVFAMLFRSILFPFVGYFIDKVKPWKVGTFSYFTIIFFPVALILSSVFNNKSLWVYIGFSFFSLALTGLSFMWNLGSIYFAKNRESSTFQGFHVTLTGIRGLLGPLIGFLLLSTSGVMSNFYIAIVLFLIAGIGTIVYNWS